MFLDRCGESLHRWEPYCWGKSRGLCSTLHKHDCSAPAPREVKLNWPAVNLVLRIDFFMCLDICFFLWRYEAAVELCKCLLESCPMNCQLLEALVALYLRTDRSSILFGEHRQSKLRKVRSTCERKTRNLMAVIPSKSFTDFLPDKIIKPYVLHTATQMIGNKVFFLDRYLQKHTNIVI